MITPFNRGEYKVYVRKKGLDWAREVIRGV